MNPKTHSNDWYCWGVYFATTVIAAHIDYTLADDDNHCVDYLLY